MACFFVEVCYNINKQERKERSMIFLLFLVTMVTLSIVVKRYCSAKSWLEDLYDEQYKYIRQRIAEGASSEEIDGIMGISTYGPFGSY